MARPASVAAKRSKASVGGVSAIVKTLRQRAGLTLNELAGKAQVAASTISKIEGGQLLPGYDIIVRLADGLGVDVAALFRPAMVAAPTGRRGVTRKGQGDRYESANYIYEALASDVARKEFLSLVATIKARDRLDWDELPSHDGEELVYVLSGVITVYSEHYEPLELREGDSVYFDSRSGHAITSAGPEDARILWVSSRHPALPSPSVPDHG